MVSRIAAPATLTSLALATETAAGAEPDEVLTTARSVLSLSRDRASARLPVKLEGTITFSDPHWGAYHLHDGHNTVYLWPGVEGLEFPPQGHRVLITGESHQGNFGTFVMATAIEDKGPASSLPEPITPTINELRHGIHDQQWIELTGVVRGVTNSDEHHGELKLSTDRFPYYAHLASPLDELLSQNLIGAEVRLRGNVGTTHTATGKPVNFHLYVQNESFVSVSNPAPEDVFQRDPIPIEQLFQIQYQQKQDQLVQVKGKVTYVRPNGFYFLEDLSGNIRVIPHEAGERPQAGDTVVVSGFLGEGPAGFSWEIADARMRNVTQTTRLRATTPRTATEILRDRPEGERVLCEGTIVASSFDEYGLEFLCAEGDIMFRTHVLHGSSHPIRHLARGARIQISGVCVVDPFIDRPINSFHLYCNAPEAITILKRPPWFTGSRVAMAFGILISVVLLGLLWVRLLRRTVRQQTATIESERTALADRVEERTTELHTANRELANAAKMKDVFLANMSHELRTPLNTVLGQADALRHGF